MSELFVVDKKGRKRRILLDMKTYRLLRGLDSVVNLKELLREIRKALKKRPPDTTSLNELLEDIDDLVEVAKRAHEETIPWEKARKELGR